MDSQRDILTQECFDLRSQVANSRRMLDLASKENGNLKGELERYRALIEPHASGENPAPPGTGSALVPSASGSLGAGTGEASFRAGAPPSLPLPPPLPPPPPKPPTDTECATSRLDGELDPGVK